MSTSSVNSLSQYYLQSLQAQAIQSTGTNLNSTNSLSASTGISSGQITDSNQLSPLAQLLTTLQNLQQSNPTQFAQVTSQIATNLQNAAQTAQSQGNTTAATQLTQLSNDFKTSSQTGQLPNIQDLAQAVGGHHGHHHHHAHVAPASSDSDSDSNSAATPSSTTASGSSQLLSQFLASLTSAAGSQNSTLDPLSIINSTLQNAGIQV